jgi:hypothetical protein
MMMTFAKTVFFAGPVVATRDRNGFRVERDGQVVSQTSVVERASAIRETFRDDVAVRAARVHVTRPSADMAVAEFVAEHGHVIADIGDGVVWAVAAEAYVSVRDMVAGTADVVVPVVHVVIRDGVAEVHGPAEAAAFWAAWADRKAAAAVDAAMSARPAVERWRGDVE